MSKYILVQITYCHNVIFEQQWRLNGCVNISCISAILWADTMVLNHKLINHLSMIKHVIGRPRIEMVLTLMVYIAGSLHICQNWGKMSLSAFSSQIVQGNEPGSLLRLLFVHVRLFIRPDIVKYQVKSWIENNLTADHRRPLILSLMVWLWYFSDHCASTFNLSSIHNNIIMVIYVCAA